MSSATLAIVDDDQPFAEYLQTMLRSRGYETNTYQSGDALLAGLREGALPDVILLDVSMPGLDGLDTLRQIRLAHPAAQVVMLSGGQTPATIVEAVRLGATDYVVKPGDPDGVGEVALEAAIRNALERLSLTSEVQRLRTQVGQDPDGAQPCWSSGRAMQPVMTMVDRVADNDVSVLLRGESGVGKEVIAREIHRRSPRRAAPFVKVNCAALPAELLESELFGHERGAFTGAASTRVGKFEFAQHGTIMLDEIGEMPQALQAKILHVLQDHEFTKLGSNRSVEVDVRVIAATNRDLELMMRHGTFREDLYYRLQVIEVHVPPLRERREEIPQLIEFFLLKFSSVYHRPATRPSLVLQEALLSYEWPGNIRELENIMKRLVVLQDETLILAELGRLRGGRAHTAGSRRNARFTFGCGGASSSARICRARSSDLARRWDRHHHGRQWREPPGARADCRNGRREGSDSARPRTVPLESPQDRRVSASQLQDALEQDEGMRNQRVAKRLTGTPLALSVIVAGQLA
jgi:two-component system response regulator AtoC